MEFIATTTRIANVFVVPPRNLPQNSSDNNSTQRAQTPPRPKCQPKVIQDSNSDSKLILIWIKIATKMLWIHCLVIVRHSVTFCKKNRRVTVCEMVKIS